MSLSQQIRNAYDARDRDELERCLRLVDAAGQAPSLLPMHPCRKGPNWHCRLEPDKQHQCVTCGAQG